MTNKVRKYIFVILQVVCFIFCLSVSAYAGRTINSATLDGDSSVTVAPAQSIRVDIQVSTSGNGSNGRWRSTSWEVDGTVHCVNHRDYFSRWGTFYENFNIAAPASAGIYDVTFVAYRNDSCSQGASASYVLNNGINVTGVTSELYYPFDEIEWSGVADEILDNGGNDFHATAENGAVTEFSSPAIAGSPGTCSYGVFDGVNDYVALPNDYPNLTTDFTITAWIKTTDNTRSGQRIFIDDQNNSSGFGLSLGDGGTGRLRLYSRSTNSIILDTPNVVQNDTWYFVTAVVDITNKEKRITVFSADGTQLANVADSYTGSWGYDNGPASIGGETDASSESGSSFHFVGNIDEVRVHEGALSSMEIQTAMDNTKECMAPLAEYRFEGCDWGSDAVVVDEQGNYPGKVVQGAHTALGATYGGGLCNIANLENEDEDFDRHISLTANPISLSGDWTLMVWVNFPLGFDQHYQSTEGSWWSSTTYSYSIIAGGTEDLCGIRQEVGTTNLEWGASSGSSYYTDFPDNLSGWHHLAIVGSGTKTFLYIDGSYHNSINYKQTGSYTHIGTTADPVSTDARQNVDTQIDELKFYDVAMSASWIEKVYDNEDSGLRWNGTALNCQPCDAGIDHFKVVHDGYGINCVAEEITITARNSDDTVATDYVGTIDLSTNTNHGTWALKTGSGSFSDPTDDDGEANYTFEASDNGVVVLTLLDSHDESVQITVIDGPVVDDDTDGDLNYNPIGFVLSPDPVGTQVGCKPFPFTLTVVGQTLNHPECGLIEEYTGDKAIKFWFDYNDPTTGSINPTISGQPINGSAATATEQNVTFASGVATVMAKYSDAGEIQIFARDDIGMGDPVAGTADEIVGGLDPFVVRPFGFDLQVTGNPAAQSASGSIFATSGTIFTANLRAVCWQSADDSDSNGIPDGHTDNDPTNNSDLANNALTPNASGAVTLTHRLWKPTSGSAGMLAGTTAMTLASGLASSTDLTYSEVGIIELAATLNDYLSGSEAIVGKTAAVGRFYPHHFTLETGTLTPRSDLSCTTPSTFTYLDENLTFAYKLIAQNESGTTTANYADGTGGFAKFDGDDAKYFGEVTGHHYTVGAVDAPSGVATALSGRLDINSSVKVSDWATGEAGFSVKLNVMRDPSPDGPFNDTRFGVAIQDSDGVAINSSDLDVDNNTVMDHTQVAASTTLRYGRLRLDNAHGSEMLNLPTLMHAEYWAGSAFSWNVVDSCTPFIPAALSLSNDIESGVNPIRVKDSVTTTATITNNPTSALNNGDGNLQFSAPGSGGDGWVDVELTVPDYLKFDWEGAGDVNPTSRATFGIYQGNEHIIYLRETTWR